MCNKVLYGKGLLINNIFFWKIVYSLVHDLVYLFNGTSTPYGLFNGEIWLICEIILIMNMYVINGQLQSFRRNFVYNYLFAHSYIVSSILM